MYKKNVTHLLDWSGHDNIIVDELEYYVMDVLSREDRKKAIIKIHRIDYNYFYAEYQLKSDVIWCKEKRRIIKTCWGVPIIIDNNVYVKHILIEFRDDLYSNFWPAQRVGDNFPKEVIKPDISMT